MFLAFRIGAVGAREAEGEEDLPSRYPKLFARRQIVVCACVRACVCII